MIRVHTYLLGSSDATVDVEIIAREESGGPGIRHVIVTSVRDGGELASQGPPEPCGPEVRMRIMGVPHGRFPIHVETMDCDNAVAGEDLPLLPPGSLSGPGVRLPCSPLFCNPDSECNRLQGQAEELRHSINVLCTERAHLKEARDLQLGIAIAAAIFAALLLALTFVLNAIPFGQGAATATGILALVVIGLMIVALGFAADLQSKIRAKTEEIRDRQRQFGVLAAQITRDCCPGCIFVDLSPPTCH